jgi:Uma2 family endonuclease
MSTQQDKLFGEPTWDIAQLFPPQGQWLESDYLSLNTNRIVELTDGRLEVLPMPTELHQLIVLALYRKLSEFIDSKQLGALLVAPLRVRLWEGKFREPDLLFMLAANSNRRGNRFWNGADLVIEVVSEDDPDRDLVEKRADYAQAGIPEYWIVDPRFRTITVLSLDNTTGRYRDVSKSVEDESAKSLLLEGLSIPVHAVFPQSQN